MRQQQAGVVTPGTNARPDEFRISLEDLAEPFARHVCEHLKITLKQSTSPSSKFLDACRAYNTDAISKSDLIAQTTKLGFVNVIDALSGRPCDGELLRRQTRCVCPAFPALILGRLMRLGRPGMPAHFRLRCAQSKAQPSAARQLAQNLLKGFLPGFGFGDVSHGFSSINSGVPAGRPVHQRFAGLRAVLAHCSPRSCCPSARR